MIRVRPSWDQYFMNIAKVVATRSPDDKTQVGCVIVDKNHRIVSTGYNGTPPGFDDKSIDWFSTEKYSIVLHAEDNAIIYSKQDLTGCILYCTLSPCAECLKSIVQSGIRRVVYLENYKTIAESIKIATVFGIELSQFKEINYEL